MTRGHDSLFAAACLLALTAAAGPAFASPALADPTQDAAAQAAAEQRPVLSAEVRAAIDAAGPDDTIEAYLVMSDQLRPRDFADLSRRGGGRERRAAVATRLKAHAATSQAGVRSYFDQVQAAGRATVTHHLWMGNALYFEARPSVFDELAALPGIDRIRLVIDEGQAAYEDVLPSPAAPSPAAPLLGAATAAYPFSDDFESGVLGPHWLTETTGTGYVVASNVFDPIGGWHVIMGSSVDASVGTASMTVVLDLTGETDVGLRFSHKEFSDEPDAEDGVFISNDGVTWLTLVSLQNGSSSYQTHTLELDPLATNLGITYDADVHFRFQWRDNYNLTTDGFAFDEITIAEGAGEPLPAVPEPNIVALQAPELWDRGYEGGGILVGNIDSGVWWTHPDLITRIWNNPGELGGTVGVDDDNNGFIDDLHGWDFLTNSADITSGDSHGTKTAGIAVGDGTSGRLTGMAPAATMIGCEISGETDYWAAQQYLLDIGVDVITSSFSYKWPAPRPDYHMHRQLCEIELAAGIIHANSIGNQGGLLGSYPIPFNVSTPGNCPAPFRHPDHPPGGETSIMACGGITLPSDVPYSSSGLGPSAWDDITLYDGSYPHGQDTDYWDYPYGGFAGGQPGLIKPDVVTYTVGIMTTTIGTGYTTFSGTSAATPHLGGAMALMRDVQPEAEPRHIAAALMLTAVDLGVPGKDNQFGAGKIQVLEAARRLSILGRLSDPQASIGTTVDLDLFTPANTAVFGFLSTSIVDDGSDFNLDLPFVYLFAQPIGPSGTDTITFNVPNSHGIIGLDIWLQFAHEAPAGEFGNGVIWSVPERFSASP